MFEFLKERLVDLEEFLERKNYDGREMTKETAEGIMDSLDKVDIAIEAARAYHIISKYEKYDIPERKTNRELFEYYMNLFTAKEVNTSLKTDLDIDSNELMVEFSKKKGESKPDGRLYLIEGQRDGGREYMRRNNWFTTFEDRKVIEIFTEETGIEVKDIYDVYSESAEVVTDELKFIYYSESEDILASNCRYISEEIPVKRGLKRSDVEKMTPEYVRYLFMLDRYERDLRRKYSEK